MGLSPRCICDTYSSSRVRAHTHTHTHTHTHLLRELGGHVLWLYDMNTDVSLSVWLESECVWSGGSTAQLCRWCDCHVTIGR